MESGTRMAAERTDGTASLRAYESRKSLGSVAKAAVSVMYLSGVINQAVLNAPEIGLMYSPKMGNRTYAKTQAIDNGRFALPWDETAWRRMLERHLSVREHVLFAVVPDVVGNASATLIDWRQWAPEVRNLGYPLAFVTQDGCSTDLVPWDELDVLFIGGSNDWKFSPSSIAIVKEAHRRGKPVHMGRVNTVRRLRGATAIGVRSVDGTFLFKAPDVNILRLRRYVGDVKSLVGLPL